MLERSSRAAGFIEPCLPSPAKKPPAGPDWQHEIKRDGFRILTRRDASGVRLLTRNGHYFTKCFPLGVTPARSCLIDGEAIVSANDLVWRTVRLRPARTRRPGLLPAADRAPQTRVSRACGRA